MPIVNEDDLEIPGFLQRSPEQIVEETVQKIDDEPELELELFDEPEPVVAKGGDGRKLKKTDNQPPAKVVDADAGGKGPASIARDQLRAIVDHIEKLEEEKKAIGEDIKEVYAEAKANGYDTKTLRQVIRLRKQDSHERKEQEALLELYMYALGMVSYDD